MLVKDAIEAFLAHTKAQINAGLLKTRTHDFYYWQLVKLKNDEDIAGLEMSAVTLPILANKPLTHQFARTLMRLFKFHRIPAPQGLKAPKKGQRERTVERDEFLRLCWATHSRVRWVLKLIYDSGLRPQEVRELLWRHVDDKKRTITLTEFKARDRRKDGLRIRHIPISPQASRLFAFARSKLNPGPNDPVFTSRNFSKPWSADALQRAVRRALRFALLATSEGEQITAYTLRHTFATRFMRAGGDSIMLSRILGHTQVSMTNRYCHPNSDDLVAARDAAFNTKQGHRSEARPPSVDVAKADHTEVKTFPESLPIPIEQLLDRRHHLPKDPPSIPPSPDSLSVKPLMQMEDVAKLVKCTSRQIRQMVEAGDMPPFFYLGRFERWNREVVEKWIAAGCPRVSPPKEL